MDDIWDEPAVVQTRPTQNSTPLFDFSNEEDPVPQPTKKAQPKSGATTSRKRTNNEDIDDVVAGLFDDIVDPTQDDTARRKELVARRANLANNALDPSPDTQNNEQDQGTGTSKDAEDKDEAKGKGKRVLPKVDEERLLGERGFPALIKEAKKFKPKGKGHEAADLDRLLSIYQFWAHNMFPKTQFRDTVDRVERVCRSRRMQINMSIWKDSERRIDEEKGDPNKSDSSDLDQDGTSKSKDTSPQNPTSSAPTQAQPIRRIIDPEDDDDMWLDVDDALESLEQAKAPETNKPPVAVDDDDLEDWFKADDGAPKDMDIDSTKPDIAPSRFLSPPTAENWDDDLYA